MAGRLSQNALHSYVGYCTDQEAPHCLLFELQLIGAAQAENQRDDVLKSKHRQMRHGGIW